MTLSAMTQKQLHELQLKSDNFGDFLTFHNQYTKKLNLAYVQTISINIMIVSA